MIYLGIDSGTQSTKTVALDFETGEIVASAQAPHSMIAGLAPGHLEQNPRQWIETAEQTLRTCLDQLGSRRTEVRGIGVSGQQHGLVTLDENDEVIRPAKLWCDTSTVEECRAFEQEFGGAEGLVDLAGNSLLPGYTAPKLLWLKRHEPQHFVRLRSILLPHDYLNFWLTGKKRMEYGDASGTALLDVRTREWCKPLCDFIDSALFGCLPSVESSCRPVGLLRNDLRVAWGLSGSPIVSAGGGDNMMSAIGTGNVVEGVFTVSLGTSGTLYARSKRPVTDRQGEIAAFCDSADHWLPLVCTMNVTVVTEQIRRLFGWSVDEFNNAAASAPAGADGLLFLPYLNGERTPNLPGGTGVCHGLNTKNTTAPMLARAALEGATLGLGYGLDRFRQLGLEPHEVRLTGGGSKSLLWRQVAADIFGVQTVCLDTSEGAALGSAIQAGVAGSSQDGSTLLVEAVRRLVETDEASRVQPRAENRDLYRDKLQRFCQLTKELHRFEFI